MRTKLEYWFLVRLNDVYRVPRQKSAMRIKWWFLTATFHHYDVAHAYIYATFSGGARYIQPCTPLLYAATCVAISVVDHWQRRALLCIRMSQYDWDLACSPVRVCSLPYHFKFPLIRGLLREPGKPAAVASEAGQHIDAVEPRRLRNSKS